MSKIEYIKFTDYQGVVRYLKIIDKQLEKSSEGEYNAAPQSQKKEQKSVVTKAKQSND